MVVYSRRPVPSGCSRLPLVVRVAAVRPGVATRREKAARPAQVLRAELAGGRRAAPAAIRVRAPAARPASQAVASVAPLAAVVAAVPRAVAAALGPAGERAGERAPAPAARRARR